MNPPGRPEAFAAIQEENLFLRSLIDAASCVAVIAASPAGLITLFNKGAENMLGYAASEVVGKVGAAQLLSDCELDPAARRLFVAPPRNGQLLKRDDDIQCGSEAEKQCSLVRRDGSTLPVHLSVSGLRDREGQVTGYLAVARNIGEQLLQEERLERARRAAESASRAKSEFLATMSHEIRTPMNGILGMAGLLLHSDLTPLQRQRTETLRSSAEALLTVLDDVIDLSRIEASKLELEVADFDVRKLVEDVADLMALKAQDKGVELLYSFDPAVPARLRGDPNRLRQVLSNLLGNSVKFTSQGSISLRVSLDNPPAAVPLRFEVTDTGIGIPEAKRHLLFQPFSQADASTTRRYGGTGLGLSIAAGLVGMLGGRVGFESREGAGSTFWFTAALDPQPHAERPPLLTLERKKVLVVDDSAPARAGLVATLKSWNCISDEASSASEAIAKLKGGNAARYDALLIDHDLPWCSGEQLAGIVRAEAALQDLPLILMTGLRQAGDMSHWRSRGFSGRVTKPVKQADLGGCLVSLFGCIPGQTIVSAPNAAARTSRPLLLVEDNEVSREVALGILENLGYSADVACDGRSALALLARNRYAAVLADCELPELDGYELTRLIRAANSDVTDHRVPVIAMTAHALPGDREKCLRAGMDEYLSKPIGAGELKGILDRLVFAECPSLPLDAPALDAPALEAPALEVPAQSARSEESADMNPHDAAFDREDLIDRMMGNEDVARRVVNRFVTDMPAQLMALSKAIADTDHDKTHLLAHSIKGAASNVSGRAVTRAAAEIEAAARNGDMLRAEGVLPGLTVEFDRLNAAFCEFLASA